MNKKLIIGISGKKQHGKDTIAAAVQNYCTDNGLRFIKLAFADALKDEVCSALTITRKHLDEHKHLFRVIMQWWGCYKRDQVMKDYWVSRTFNKMLKEMNDHDVIVISDVRFLNEAERIKEIGGKLWRVNRTDLAHSLDFHPSETELDAYKFETVFTNDSTIQSLSVNVNIELNILLKPTPPTRK